MTNSGIRTSPQDSGHGKDRETPTGVEVEASKTFADLATGVDWSAPDAWPPEFKQLIEFSAFTAYLALTEMGMQMLRIFITNTPEPVTMLFAIGDRAPELEQAWEQIRARHPSTTAADAASEVRS